MDAVHELIKHYGLWVILVGTFFQGQTVLIGAGFLAAAHILDPVEILAIGILGSWTGHIFWYYLGRSLIGIAEEKTWVLAKKISSISHFIGLRPWTSIFTLQYVYGIRLAGAISFGMSEMTVGWFIAVQLFNCILWTVLIESAGYFVGDLIHSGSGIAVFRSVWIGGTLILLFLFFRKYRHHAELSQ
jgi:membrane-associated protein